MIFRNKGDREAYLRERTISSMQANKYILEGDWISTPYFTYIAVTEETDVPLQNGLFAKMLPFPLASKSEFGRVQIGNGLEIENGVLKHPDKHSADIIEPDSNNRFVTDEQIDMWTGKVSKEELAEAIENFSKGMVWKESVPTFDDIATTYPNPQDTWTVITKDKNDIYMYESDTNEWKYLGNIIVHEKASADKDGLMSKEHFTKLESIDLETFSPYSVVENTTERDAISDVIRYTGMAVYVKDIKKLYMLKDGIENSNWEEVVLVSVDEVSKWNSKAEGVHSHDDLYYTESEMNNKLDEKANKTIQIIAGNGLTGGGTFEANRTVNVASANDGIIVNADNIQLNTVDNVSSTSTSRPLTANMGKYLNDNKLNIAGGTITGNLNVNGYIASTAQDIRIPNNKSLTSYKTDGTIMYLTYADTSNRVHIGYQNGYSIYLDSNNIAVNGGFATTAQDLRGAISELNSGKAASNHTHTKSQITDFPASLKNPNALTISFNGTSQGAYDGSSAKTINITPSGIGAAATSHGTHVTYGTSAPKVAGTASAGSSGNVSREDHVHPVQTSVSGNAGTATKLQTARSINGTNFDGSGNITTANWGTARTITIGNSGKSVNGSGNVSYSLSEIGAAASNHNHDGTYLKTVPVGSISDEATLNAATTPGVYQVNGYNINGMYGWGFLYVTKNGGAISQYYVSHNAGTCYRQDWNGNIANATWVKQYDTQNFNPNSYLPLSGGTMTGNLVGGSSNTISGFGKVYNAVWNDYAEFFERGEDTEAGDIIALDSFSDKEQYVKASRDNYLIVGVHSNTFAHLIGGEEPPVDENGNQLDFYEYNIKKYIPIGLSGRIKVKVIGKVSKGNYIGLSDIAGVGIANESIANINCGVAIPMTVGMALEDKSTDEIGLVKVLIK